jgi:hypothetical protein
MPIECVLYRMCSLKKFSQASALVYLLSKATNEHAFEKGFFLKKPKSGT